MNEHKLLSGNETPKNLSVGTVVLVGLCTVKEPVSAELLIKFLKSTKVLQLKEVKDAIEKLVAEGYVKEENGKYIAEDDTRDTIVDLQQLKKDWDNRKTDENTSD